MNSKNFLIYLTCASCINSASYAFYIGDVNEPRHVLNLAESTPDTQTLPRVPAVESISFSNSIAPNSDPDEITGPNPNILDSKAFFNTNDPQVDVSENATPENAALHAMKGPPQGRRMQPPDGIGLCKSLQSLFCCFADFLGCVLYDNHMGPPLCGINDERIYFACCDNIQKTMPEKRIYPPQNCKLAPGEVKRRKQFDPPVQNSDDQPGTAQQLGEGAWKIITTPWLGWPIIEKPWEKKEPGI